MVHFTSAIAIIAGAIGLVAAQSYQDFTLDPTVLPTFVSPAFGLAGVVGDLAAGKAACNAVDDCLGVICQSGSNVCVPFAYNAGGVLTPGETGYDAISYRYNTPTGPRCDLFVDEFINAQGQCQCSALENQNTNFGCVSAIAASGLPQVQRRSRLTPGHVQRSSFERRRANGGVFA